MKTKIKNVEFYFSHDCEDGGNQRAILDMNDVIESGVPICTGCDEEFELEYECEVLA